MSLLRNSMLQDVSDERITLICQLILNKKCIDITSDSRIPRLRDQQTEIRGWPCALIFPHQNVKCLL